MAEFSPCRLISPRKNAINDLQQLMKKASEECFCNWAHIDCNAGRWKSRGPVVWWAGNGWWWWWCAEAVLEAERTCDLQPASGVVCCMSDMYICCLVCWYSGDHVCMCVRMYVVIIISHTYAHCCMWWPVPGVRYLPPPVSTHWLCPHTARPEHPAGELRQRAEARQGGQEWSESSSVLRLFFTYFADNFSEQWLTLSSWFLPELTIIPYGSV